MEENKKSCWEKGRSDNDVNLVLVHEMLKDKKDVRVSANENSNFGQF